MNGSSLVTGRTKSGRYKVYIWGTTDNHMIDWRGCNHRSISIEGQPKNGYAQKNGGREIRCVGCQLAGE